MGVEAEPEWESEVLDCSVFQAESEIITTE